MFKFVRQIVPDSIAPALLTLFFMKLVLSSEGKNHRHYFHSTVISFALLNLSWEIDFSFREFYRNYC